MNIQYIQDNESLERFIGEVDGLHDALLHEAVLVHQGYVASNGQMFGESELPDVRMVFQSQSPEVKGVQVNLTAVSRFRFEPELELQLEGEVIGSIVILYPSGKAMAALSEIRAARAEYALLDLQSRGPVHRLVRSAESE